MPSLSAIAVALIQVQKRDRNHEIYTPLCATSIRTNHNAVLPPIDFTFNVANHRWLRKQVIHWDVEEALNLACMQVHRDDMVAPGDDDHIRDELSGDGRTRLVFLVDACIRKTGYHRCNASGAGGLARRDEDEELHEVVVDVAATGLDDEHVLLAHGLADLHAGLAIRKLLHDARRQSDVESR